MKVRTSQSGVFVAQWEHIKNSQKGADFATHHPLSTKNEKSRWPLAPTASAAAPGLRHISLMQGYKVYGAHLGPFKTPARETDAGHMPPEFSADQQNYPGRKSPVTSVSRRSPAADVAGSHHGGQKTAVE